MNPQFTYFAEEDPSDYLMDRPGLKPYEEMECQHNINTNQAAPYLSRTNTANFTASGGVCSTTTASTNAAQEDTTGPSAFRRVCAEEKQKLASTATSAMYMTHTDTIDLTNIEGVCTEEKQPEGCSLSRLIHRLPTQVWIKSTLVLGIICFALIVVVLVVSTSKTAHDSPALPVVAPPDLRVTINNFLSNVSGCYDVTGYTMAASTGNFRLFRSGGYSTQEDHVSGSTKFCLGAASTGFTASLLAILLPQKYR